MSDAKFVLSPQALDDLDQIWLHLMEDSVEAADHVERELRKAIRLLGDRPEIGHHREDLTGLPVKFRPVYSYLIEYNPERRPVEIVRVLHGAQDLRRLL
jgi:plasmid stabilization system protein ParE